MISGKNDQATAATGGGARLASFGAVHELVSR
jgi:hypothetical protein